MYIQKYNEAWNFSIHQFLLLLNIQHECSEAFSRLEELRIAMPSSSATWRTGGSRARGTRWRTSGRKLMHQMGCVALCCDRKSIIKRKWNCTEMMVENSQRWINSCKEHIKNVQNPWRILAKIPKSACSVMQKWDWVLNKTWLNRFTVQTVVQWDTI